MSSPEMQPDKVRNKSVQPDGSDEESATAQQPIPDFAGMTVQAAMDWEPSFFEIRCCFEASPCADPHVESDCSNPEDHLEKVILRNHESCEPGTMVVAPHLVGVYIHDA